MICTYKEIIIDENTGDEFNKECSNDAGSLKTNNEPTCRECREHIRKKAIDERLTLEPMSFIDVIEYRAMRDDEKRQENNYAAMKKLQTKLAKKYMKKQMNIGPYGLTFKQLKSLYSERRNAINEGKSNEQENKSS